MIEKLDSKMDCVEITVLGKCTECLGFDSAKEIGKKLNELVDAVNELHEEAENNARIRANHENLIDTLVQENNIHEKQIDELQMKLEPEKCETFVSIDEALKKAQKAEPADPYAEQRKWVGKICRFWNDDESLEDSTYGELVNIFDAPHEDCPFQCGYGEWYEHCEPVKPDDDIIYKGE